MKKINEEFDIPFYIFEEITEYLEQTAKGRCRPTKWKNIKALLKLAQVNNRLSEQQVDYLIKSYCRE